jgi:Dynamin family.
MTTDMLTDHRRLRANMVTDLKQAQEFARKMELHEVVEHVDTLLLQHEHRNFNVAVVGEFKRGKSTLINALLRRQVLPANVLPCSATLNRITYGIHPLVEIHYRERDGQPGSVEQITIEQLAEYVTKLTPESERRAADIEEAIVQYPLELCKNGVDIIDTPGLNDEDNMTAITSSVLQRTDAAIFVILATSPFSETEKEFLNNMLTEDLAQVLFVVNRIDSIDDADDRRNVLHLIERRIKESVESKAARQWGKDSEEYQNYVRRMGKPRVFGVSSSQALRAATKGPEELRQTSGFAEFEQELVRFLTHDKDATALRVIANCTIDTCNKILTGLL